MKVIKIIIAIILLYGGAILAYGTLTYQPTGDVERTLALAKQQMETNSQAIANAKTEQEREKLRTDILNLEQSNSQVRQIILKYRVVGSAASVIVMASGGLLLWKTFKKKPSEISGKRATR